LIICQRYWLKFLIILTRILDYMPKVLVEILDYIKSNARHGKNNCDYMHFRMRRRDKGIGRNSDDI